MQQEWLLRRWLPRWCSCSLHPLLLAPPPRPPLRSPACLRPSSTAPASMAAPRHQRQRPRPCRQPPPPPPQPRRPFVAVVSDRGRLEMPHSPREFPPVLRGGALLPAAMAAVSRHSCSASSSSFSRTRTPLARSSLSPPEPITRFVGNNERRQSHTVRWRMHNLVVLQT